MTEEVRESMLNPKLGFFVLCHPLEEGKEKAPEFLHKATERLKKFSLEVVNLDIIVEDEKGANLVAEKFKEEEVDTICVLEATWSSDHLVLDILERVHVPIVTWGVPGVRCGSLCGVQQLDCVLTELGKPYRFVYGSVEEDEPYRVIQRYTKAAFLKKKLRKTLLALIGYRVKGMSEVSFDELELKSLLGPRLIHYGIDELRKMITEVEEEKVKSLWEEVRRRVGEVKVNEKEVIYSSKVYLALKTLAEKDNLSGFAVECYPELMGKVCLAYLC